MDPYIEANRRHWDELVDLNARSSFYDLEGFKRGNSALSDIEVRELGDVAGRTLLHLQCHFGMGSLSWARLGAHVTGVDLSEAAIILARSLSRELNVLAEFICANVYDLPKTLDRTYDIVFTSYGVVCWLPDLPAWARLIARYLRTGGTFYIVEDHPLVWMFPSGQDARELVVKHPYFPTQPLQSEEGDGYYADPDAHFVNDRRYEWQHTLSDIVNALIEAGLRVEFLHEHSVSVWRRFPFMEQDATGWWRLPERLRVSVPLTFSLRATK
jgi:SAM-dependent methyltransferase